jgi:hypothetical protein
MWIVSLPFRCVAVWDIERGSSPTSHAGLVHMLQLASKTGATLAGKSFPFPIPGTGPTVL